MPLPVKAHYLDRLIGELFKICDRGRIKTQPSERFKLLHVLVDALGDFSPDIFRPNVEKDLLQLLGDGHEEAATKALLTKVEALGKDIRHCVNATLPNTTYCAASYFSPIQPDRRHTLTRRIALEKGKRMVEDKQTVLAYAYAFYALTHLGSQRKSHYSIMQYAVTAAPKKDAPNVSYAASPVPEDGWIHLPATMQDAVLKETGLAEAIDQHLLTSAANSERTLERLLTKALANSPVDPWTDEGKFAASYLEDFDRRCSLVSKPVRVLVEKARQGLESTFGNSESEIDFRQALFMVASHYAYRVACPATYIYSNVIRHFGSHCAMTVGTCDMLNPATELFLRDLSRSIFIGPLHQDLAHVQERDAKNSARHRAFQHFNHQMRAPINPMYFIVQQAISGLSNEQGLSTVRNELERFLERLDQFRALLDNADPTGLTESQHATSKSRDDFIAGTCNLDQRVRKFLEDPFLLELPASFEPLEIEGAPRRVKGGNAGWTDIIYTLLQNAAKYTTEAGSKIGIRLIYADASPGRTPMLAIAIKNQCPEIKRDCLQEMSEALNGEREELSAECKSASGHGIGLGIAGAKLRRIGAISTATWSDGWLTITIGRIVAYDA